MSFMVGVSSRCDDDIDDRQWPLWASERYQAEIWKMSKWVESCPLHLPSESRVGAAHHGQNNAILLNAAVE